MKKRIVVIVVVVIAAAASVAYRVWGRAARTDQANVLHLSGNIEVRDAELSFKIPGRVEQRLVREGDAVREGQLVAVLDSAELSEEAAARRADVQTAREELAELEAGSRPEEIKQGEANLGLVQAEELRLRTDRERLRKLHEKDLISHQQWDAAVTAHEVATARVREAQERLELLRQGPRREKIAQARSRLERARQSLAMADTRLGYAKLISPVNGIVLSENIEPGEYVSPGTPIVTTAQLSDVWMRGYVPETDLGRVKLGQPVCVTSDTFLGKQYSGRVTFISSQAEFTPKMVQTQKERVKLVYRIKVDIANPELELKPGMPADAVVQVGGGQEPCRQSGSTR
ncbi:MAG TPA: efflux RND transporter periplasmic adaptor subunit [Clostridia bacterium]|nr:efflux RND transporter periplasmic adaptor subunit [Clostridia bacterium]